MFPRVGRVLFNDSQEFWSLLLSFLIISFHVFLSFSWKTTTTLEGSTFSRSAILFHYFQMTKSLHSSILQTFHQFYSSSKFLCRNPILMPTSLHTILRYVCLQIYTYHYIVHSTHEQLAEDEITAFL